MKSWVFMLALVAGSMMAFAENEQAPVFGQLELKAMLQKGDVKSPADVLKRLPTSLRKNYVLIPGKQGADSDIWLRGPKTIVKVSGTEKNKMEIYGYDSYAPGWYKTEVTFPDDKKGYVTMKDDPIAYRNEGEFLPRQKTTGPDFSSYPGWPGAFSSAKWSSTIAPTAGDSTSGKGCPAGFIPASVGTSSQCLKLNGFLKQ